MKTAMTKAEHDHIERIKGMRCGVCGQSAPCDALHITEGGWRVSHYATIPLCRECHDQVPNGPMWKVMRKTELLVLAETIKALT